MKYNESLAVAWLLIWRTAAISTAFLAPIFFTLGLVEGYKGTETLGFVHINPFLEGALEFVLELALELAVFFVWVLNGAIRKNYSGFVLAVEREEVAPAVAA